MDNTVGIFPEIDVAAYHAEAGCTVPSLSASIGKPLVPKRTFTTTPLHVWNDHPVLNKNFVSWNKKEFDKGNTMHELILGKGHGLVVLDYPDYKKKAAQAARDAAYEEGKTPVLASVHAEMLQAKAVADRLLSQTPWGHPFTDGQAEVALRWIEKTKWGDVHCKALVDWLPNKRPLERGIDYKSTGQTANPEWWDKRQLNSLGYDISAAFHRRGYRALGLAHDCDYLWVVQEWDAPYACSIVGYDSEELDKAEADIQRMIDTFGKCLHTKTWPGYDMEPWFAKRPKWTEYNIRIESDGHLSSEDIAARL